MEHRGHRAVHALIIAAASIAVVAPGRAAAAPDELRVEVDGRRVWFGRYSRPYIDRGVWMVPVRPVLEAAGLWHSWDPQRGELEVRTNYERAVIRTNSYTVRIAVMTEILSRAMVISGGEPCVPAEFIERRLKQQAEFDRQGMTLSFSTGARSGWSDWDRGSGRGGWRGDRGRGSDRRPDLRVNWPGRSISGGSGIRISGETRGSTVKVRIHRTEGGTAIDRQTGVSSGEFSVTVSLSPGEYRAVVEAYDGRVLCGSEQMTFTVGSTGRRGK